MSYAAFEDFLPTLRSNLPGATQAGIKQAFEDAAITFYRRSRGWIECIPGVSIVSGRNTIYLEPVDQRASIAFLESVSDAVSGATMWGRMIDPHRLEIESDAERTIDIVVAVTPKIGADVLPLYALTHHKDGLESGTLARMFAQPSKPYSNDVLAAMNARRFESEIARATSLRKTGSGVHAIPWRYPVVPLR